MSGAQSAVAAVQAGAVFCWVSSRSLWPRENQVTSQPEVMQPSQPSFPASPRPLPLICLRSQRWPFPRLPAVLLLFVLSFIVLF